MRRALDDHSVFVLNISYDTVEGPLKGLCDPYVLCRFRWTASCALRLAVVGFGVICGLTCRFVSENARALVSAPFRYGIVTHVRVPRDGRGKYANSFLLASSHGRRFSYRVVRLGRAGHAGLRSWSLITWCVCLLACTRSLRCMCRRLMCCAWTGVS